MKLGKKIAIYWIQKDYGGVEEVLLNLLKFWPNKKDKFYLFTNQSSNQGYLRLKKNFKFKKVFNIESDWIDENFYFFKIIKYIFFSFYFRKYQQKTFKEIKSTKIKFDVLIVNNGGYPGSWKSMSSLKSAIDMNIKKTYLIVHHGAIHDHFILRPGERVFDKKIQYWTKKIITVSNATAKTLILNRLFDPKKIKIIHNGINFKKKNNFRKKKLNKFVYLGLLGRIEKYKGLDDLVNAVSLLPKKQVLKIRLLIAGKFININEQVRIKKIITKLDLKKNVKFLGYIKPNNIKFFFRKLDLFFSLTKDFEGFGLTILEAIKYKIPVACTNVGGIKEIIDKTTVSLIKPNNPESVAAAIQKYFDDPISFKKKAEIAYKICSKFSARKMAKSYYNVINK
jgi:glycosyltransferase involved in cell wall biosynthesis